MRRVQDLEIRGIKVMRAAYLDCFSGISGNMALAALIDAGVPARWLRETVKKVVPDHRLVVKQAMRCGIGGVHVRVTYNKKAQPHRRLSHIVKMIRAGALAEPVRERSIEVFKKLAEVEAKVHRIDLQQVHFHEVGAVDAIVDVVGTVAGLHRLGIDELSCSPLPLSGGEVECAHGTLPLPAPAVMELVKGIPIKGVAGEVELVTPTGAALAVTLAGSFGPMPQMRVETVGVGLGDRELDGRPNLLRLIVGESMSIGQSMVQFEAAIDDMNAEHFDFLMERLHEAGALEVLLVPAQMKKNRPGTLVRALAGPENRERVQGAFFSHSTTLGVRMWEVGRTVAARESLTVKTPYGKVRVKKARQPDGGYTQKPEYDDLKRSAKNSGTSLRTVERAVWEALNKPATKAHTKSGSGRARRSGK